MESSKLFTAPISISPESCSAQFAEKMLATVRHLQLKNENSSVAGMVTVTIGVAAALPDNEASVLTHMERADQMLYAAKQKGRNCVCITPEKADSP